MICNEDDNGMARRNKMRDQIIEIENVLGRCERGQILIK